MRADQRRYPEWSVTWWSKAWLAFMPIFLFFGCRHMVNGEFHEAAFAFSCLWLFAALFVLERTEVRRVSWSARSAAYWVMTSVAVAVAVLLGLVTGIWVLPGASLLTLLILEGLIQERYERSAAG
jgi:succinate dehydrogenase hydrophobic anchor subunit